MTLWLSLLILAASSDAPMEHPGAEVVYRTSFEQDDDINFDAWPDGWTRRRGEGFPLYVNIAIADEPDAPESHCLRITLDGGAASVYSQPITIDPHFSYVVQGRLRTAQLQRDSVFFSLTFLPESRADEPAPESDAKEVHLSPKFTDVAAWHHVEIGPVTPSSLTTRKATIGLHVIPVGRPDLRGVILFDDIRLLRLPQLAVTSQNKQNIFLDPQDVAFSCAAAGLRRAKPEVHWELFDAAGHSLATETLTAPPISTGTEPTVAVEAHTAGNTSDDEHPDPPSEPSEPSQASEPSSEGLPASVTWRPPVPGIGYYTVRATWQQDDGHQLHHTVSFVVTRPCTDPVRGEFGWSIPPGKIPVANDDLLKLLTLSHVSWLKCAIPTDEQDTAALDDLAAFVDQLKAQNIEVVGTFVEVPASARRKLVGKEQPTLADLFLEQELWQSWLGALTSRFSSRIAYWQLGFDGDDCFLDLDGPSRIVPPVRQFLVDAGNRGQVGLAWQWTQTFPAASHTPVASFLSLSESPDFTHDELERYAAATRSHDVVWFALRPLSRRMYSEEDRIRDLVVRLITARTRNKSVVFVTDPFHDDHGLLNRDGTPSELLLPWTTTAEQLSGARFLGRLQFHADSSNYLFERGNEAVVAIWNDQETTESLRLGSRVGRVDVWGQAVPAVETERTRSVQTVHVGRLPLFLTGLPLPLARWQVNCSWEPGQLASVAGLRQPARVRFHNPFPRDIRGTVTVRTPRNWEVSQASFPIKLAANESQELQFDIVLQSDACAGLQNVALDFAIEADRPYTFRVERRVDVGWGDVFVQVDSWTDREGRLTVEQHLTNTSARPLSFNCYLYAPGHRRVRHQVLDLAAGSASHAFVLPDSRELSGQSLWLRVEEIGGVRTMNYELASPP